MRAVRWMMGCAVVAGCGGEASYQDGVATEASVRAPRAVAHEMQAGLMASTTSLGYVAGQDAAGQDGTALQPPTPNEGRRLIYQGRLQLAVGDVDVVAERARTLVETCGGYLQSLNGSTQVFRVPVAHWDSIFESLASLGRIRARWMEVQDVTEQFIDLGLRIANLRTLMARLDQLLEKANSVDEALAVETERARVRGELERLEGQLQGLSHRAAFSTLTFELVPASTQSPAARRLPFDWLEELGVERLLNVGGAP